MLIRPMRLEDVGAVERLTDDAFYDLETRTHPADWPPPERRPRERAARWRERAAHLIEHDPAGCWVAEAAGHLLGIALSFKREGLWGLASYAVSPVAQGKGVGTALLETTLAYSTGCLRGMIFSSHDPRAARRYRLAGFSLHPTMALSGKVDRSALALYDGIREGTAADLDLCDSVDRQTRDAGHGVDHELMSSQFPLLVADRTTGSGYCYVSDGAPYLLAATNRRTATRLLWACMATAGNEPITVGRLTASQEWALDVGLAAGLEVRSHGYLALRNMKPPMPYIPSGHFL